MLQEAKKVMCELNTNDIMKTSTFRKVDGTIIVDVAQYIKDYFALKRKESVDGFEIFIGTDSQRVRRGRLTLYATVICLYTIGKGAHIIYARTKRNDIAPTARKRRGRGDAKRPSDSGLFYRLQWEIDYSMQVANYLNSNGVFAECNVAQVHLDISVNEENDSNIAYGYAMAVASTYNPRCKPNSVAASYAADMVVRK